MDVYDYYFSMWGAPSREAEFVIMGLEIEVLKWDGDATDMGATLYATIGASGDERSRIAGSHSVEFFTGFNPEIDSIAESLAVLATFPRKVQPISVGETVTLQEPLWDGSPMRTYLTVPPLEEIVPPLVKDDRSHIEFIHVVPIFDCELEIKKSKGAEWLLGELNDNGIRLSNPFRQSLC